MGREIGDDVVGFIERGSIDKEAWDLDLSSDALEVVAGCGVCGDVAQGNLHVMRFHITAHLEALGARWHMVEGKLPVHENPFYARWVASLMCTRFYRKMTC